MEATKINAIMDKLDEFDENKKHRENSTNHFVPLYEANDEEGTHHKEKPKTPSIVLSEK